MKEFLERIKLIEHLTTELQISTQEFVDKLSAAVDPVDIDFFSNSFEAFSSSKNEFRGRVDYSGFKIKIRRRMFDRHSNYAVAAGTFNEHNGHLVIETEIAGITAMMAISIIAIIFFCAIFLTVMALTPPFELGRAPLLSSMLVLTLMVGASYISMRRSIYRLKYELEREFFYLTKK